jgi:hypothetical protein
MKYRVKLTPAAHCLLETDNDALNTARGYTVEGLYLVGEKRGFYFARDTLNEYACGWRDLDHPASGVRTARAAMAAIDKVVPDLDKDVNHFSPPAE